MKYTSIPSRVRAMQGMDYSPVDEAEVKIEMEAEAELKRQKAKVEMWRMEAGIYTQASVTYQGKQFILVLNHDSNVTDPNEIIQVIEKFYDCVDLGKTAILKKASENGKHVNTQVVTEEKPVVKKEKGKHGGNNKPIVDKNLTVLGMEYNTNIYKERVIQILAYAMKRTRDENLSEADRESFTTLDVLRDVFLPIYKDNSSITVRNKVTATLRFMASKQWIVQIGTTNNKTSIYVVGEHPFGNELPAQAEPFDEEYAKESKLKALETYRRE